MEPTYRTIRANKMHKHPTQRPKKIENSIIRNRQNIQPGFSIGLQFITDRTQYRTTSTPPQDRHGILAIATWSSPTRCRSPRATPSSAPRRHRTAGRHYPQCLPGGISAVNPSRPATGRRRENWENVQWLISPERARHPSALVDSLETHDSLAPVTALWASGRR